MLSNKFQEIIKAWVEEFEYEVSMSSGGDFTVAIGVCKRTGSVNILTSDWGYEEDDDRATNLVFIEGGSPASKELIRIMNSVGGFSCK